MIAAGHTGDMTSVSPIARAASHLLDLALPATCVGCGREGEPICSGCLPALRVRNDHPPGISVGVPADLPAPLIQLEWCAPFTGIVRRAILELKYAGERRLAEPLGRAVAERWRRSGAAGELLVPVPVHRDRERERGFDQAWLIADAAARSLGMPAARALVRRRATTRQYDLGQAQRAANIAASFALDPSAERLVRDRWIVLVDDVVTTGSTLAECAATLLAAGALAVSAVTVARER
jgi:ComF family protein